MLLTIEEYNGLGFDGCETEADIPAAEKAIGRAFRMIDLLTDGKASAAEKGEITNEAAVGNLKQAIGAQAEFYLENGACPTPGKTVLGDFSYTVENEGINAISPVAMAILKLSGLFYRGVAA